MPRLLILVLLIVSPPAAQRFMRSGETLITVVGDAKKLAPQLSSLSEAGVLWADHNGLVVTANEERQN